MINELCDCGKMALWCYMPGYSSGKSPYHCDNCVPRGCECNHNYCNVDAYHPPLETGNLPEGDEGVDWKWIDEGKIYTPLDNEGREYPCVEFMFDQSGFERDINPHI